MRARSSRIEWARADARSGAVAQGAAGRFGIDAAALEETVREYNSAVIVGKFNHRALDDCRTQGLTPPKTHWAQRIDRPPFIGYPLRPGITFTYLGLRVTEKANVSKNIFAAGEIMAYLDRQPGDGDPAHRVAEIGDPERAQQAADSSSAVLFRSRPCSPQPWPRAWAGTR